MNIWICKQCDHQWVGRKVGTPNYCPKCRTVYWNISEKLPKRDETSYKQRSRYHLDQLEVGQSMLFPWNRSVDKMADEKKNGTMHASISAYIRRSGRTIYLFPEPGGLRVFRKA